MSARSGGPLVSVIGAAFSACTATTQDPCLAQDRYAVTHSARGQTE